MKKLMMIVLTLVAAPVVAGHIDCSANLVTEGVCRDEANHVLYFDAPMPTFVELRDAIAVQTGYRDQVVCTQELVDVAICSAGQLGQMIANPVSKADYAEAWIKGVLRELVVRQRVADARSTADEGVDPTVDVGD